MQKEMETWRKAREVGEREERSYTDATAGLPVPKVTAEREVCFAIPDPRILKHIGRIVDIHCCRMLWLRIRDPCTAGNSLAAWTTTIHASRLPSGCLRVINRPAGSCVPEPAPETEHHACQDGHVMC